jgi:hypothetical protein
MATRLYIASDLHAAEKAWRKFVNAIRLNVYKADVALLAGDLTGKAIVPIIQSNGRYDTELFGVHRSARTDEELAALERDIADVGYYSFVTTSDEAGRLSTDEAGRDELLARLMNERVEAWMALATERLADSSSTVPNGVRATSTARSSICPATCSCWRLAGRTTRPGRLRARSQRTSCTHGSTRSPNRSAIRGARCS